MLKRLLYLVVLVPLAILIVVLSVANRHVVTLAFNPFNPADSVLSVNLPFFVFLFAAVMLGVVIGWLVTWLTQGKYRRQARNEAHAARRWREEADKQKNRVEELTAKTLLSAASK
jgi:uncharacterized integral membrane protein